MRMHSSGLLALLTASMTPTPSYARAVDLYSEINVKGSVEVNIVAGSGAPACATFWWVKRLTGGVTQLGRHCGYAKFNIPSMLGISVASKLRASADDGVTIRVRASEGVAKTVRL